MKTVGIRELKRHTGAILRLVREEGQKVRITYRGRVVALIVPVSPAGEADESAWETLDALAAEIGERWSGAQTSVEALAEVRR